MRKIGKCLGLCMLLPVLFWTGALISDRATLSRDLIRLHVVAHSDSAEDQAVKLKVRDAVLESIQADLEKAADVEAAKAYLAQNLPRIQQAANGALRKLGVEEEAVVTLCREEFSKRVYDTFSLPAGVYESLRIVIGSGEGKNWWCVAFPQLCLPGAAEEFEDTAVGAGFSQQLSGTLAGEEDYEIRFYFLEKLGQLQNFFFRD